MCRDMFRLQETAGGYFDEITFQMDLVGSFNDFRGYSEELIFSLLRKLPINHTDFIL